jgi:hypothetical protein
MPNCVEPDCKNYVTAEGLNCRIHQDQAGNAFCTVTYKGEGIVQLPYGNFSKGTSATIPKAAADALDKKDWDVVPQ